MKASVKVPEGKLVKVELEEEKSVISRVEIRGDFFIEPPEKLGQLEDSIEGLETDAEQEEVEEALEDVDAELIGFSRSDVAEAITKAVKGDER